MRDKFIFPKEKLVPQPTSFSTDFGYIEINELFCKYLSKVGFYQKEIKVRRNKKKELSDKLIKVMRTNDIECFDINNGKLLYNFSTCHYYSSAFISQKLEF